MGNVFKTNKDFIQELQKKKQLYSLEKDGKPTTILQKIFALAYPITLLFLIIINFLLLIKIKNIRWKTFIPLVIIGCILGWSWDILILKYDPEYPAFIFPLWAVSGIEYILTLEDWLFFPVCTILFYCIYRLLPQGSPTSSNTYHSLIITFYTICTLFFLIFGALAGRSQSIMLAAPGILLYWYAKDTINVKKFLTIQFFIWIFEALWDWAAVSWIHYIPGFSWASQWAYITFDAQGGYHHSKVFLDYGKYSWAWIFDNPIEITPWNAISGGILNFSLIAALDKFFYKKANE